MLGLWAKTFPDFEQFSHPSHAKTGNIATTATITMLGFLLSFQVITSGFARSDHHSTRNAAIFWAVDLRVSEMHLKNFTSTDGDAAKLARFWENFGIEIRLNQEFAMGHDHF